MLLAVYFALKGLIPLLGDIATALLEPFAIILIILVGISMLFGIIGMKMPTNMGSTIIGGIIKVIGWVGQRIWNGFKWITRHTVLLIPIIYRRSKDMFVKWGMGKVSAFLAVLICLNVILIII